MRHYLLSSLAGHDILDIVDYVDSENPAAARRLRDRLYAAFNQLAAYPGLGHARDDLVPRTQGLRFWTVGRYLVIYRAVGDSIEIVRVLSGYRDIGVLLSPTD